MIAHTDIKCALCGKGEFDHDRVNGECLIWRRASPEGRPYGMKRRVMRVEGWVITAIEPET